jgi:2,3-bisphosphoglycerate-dependent phosphoglycerate mutase
VGTLILLRHGQSQWNLENRFTGWTNVPLTEQGKKDAAACASVLQEFGFDIAFTSRLLRARDTLGIILRTLGHSKVTITEDSALNERHYGDLQGLNKAETTEKYGVDQVQLWRRSFFTRPPNGESMEDCERRTLPFYKQYVAPLVAEGKTVLIVAHGNSLRPIIKFLDAITPEVAASLEIGLCTPYIYTIDGSRVVNKEIREVPGIVTMGSSLMEKRLEK